MWKAFVFGAVVAGAIGPIALLVFGTAARQGFAAGAFAGLGAALADFLYALAAFSIGALVMPLVAAHEKSIAVGCALLLIGLGAAMLLRLARGNVEAAMARPAAKALVPTFLLTIVNPMTLVVFAGIVPQLPVAGSFAKAAARALALAAGSAAVQLAIAGSGAALGRAMPGENGRRAITAAAAAVLAIAGSGAALGRAMPGENGRRAITAAAAAGIVAFGIYGLASAF